MRTITNNPLRGLWRLRMSWSTWCPRGITALLFILCSLHLIQELKMYSNTDDNQLSLLRKWPSRSLYEVSSNSTAIKGYRGRSIYILDSGVKHLIPDWITFLRYSTFSICSLVPMFSYANKHIFMHSTVHYFTRTQT